ncbi:hypothetical protein V6N13_057828 [Hibiscus sabdariffa]
MVRGVNCHGRFVPRMVVIPFFMNPRKPMILALARPDPKKNIATLVKAFGEGRPLKKFSNLTLIMRNHDNIGNVWNQCNCASKHQGQYEVPDIYCLAAKTKGVFINPAFIEPFGLTLIEVAAYGLPIVATKIGGHIDIHKVLDNGVLVDPHDQQSIADALLKLVSDKQSEIVLEDESRSTVHCYAFNVKDPELVPQLKSFES